MHQSTLEDAHNVLVHLFCPLSRPYHSTGDQERLREATNLIASCSTQSAPPIRAGLLRDGYNSSTTVWANPTTRSGGFTVKDSNGRATYAPLVYEYSLPPPPQDAPEPTPSFLREEFLCPPGEEDLYLPRKRRKIESSDHKGRRRRADLTEWDTSTSARIGDILPVADDELFRLSDLDEFESSDFTCITAAHVGSGTKERALQAKDPPLSQAQVKVTRPIFGPDSLYELIPQPHLHKSLISLPSHPTKKPKDPSLPPYQKSTPQYLPPYASPGTSPSLSSSFNDPYARTAWIVPIRGRFTGPFLQTTSASFQFPPNSTPEPPPRLDAARNEMQWSPSSLVSFWNFLLQVREARQVGSIGVSLHLAVPEHLPLNSDTVGIPICPSQRISREGRGLESMGGLEDWTGVRSIFPSVHAAGQTGTETRNGTLSLEQDDEQLGQPRSWFCSTTSNITPMLGNEDPTRTVNSTVQQESMSRSMELDAPPSNEVLDRPTGQEGEQDLSCLSARMDYIKVYHEARYAFVVRNVLHLWGYTPAPVTLPPAAPMDVDADTTADMIMTTGRRGDEHKNTLGRGKEAGQKGSKKVRLLKGAKLLLVDSRSRGVLIS